jgi:hypothetical protein
MGSSGGSSKGSSTVRYAPYIETEHRLFLAHTKAYVSLLINKSPYAGFTELDVDDGFFGVGYTLTSFPALYDLYGKFMAGLDVEALWRQVYNATVEGPEVNDMVSAESALLDDEIEETSLPRFQLGMRNVNAVHTSSFVIGKALIESAKVKQLAKTDSELRYKMVSVAADRWKTHLAWNESVTKFYPELLKLFVSAKMDVDSHNYELKAKNALWPFTVLDFHKANLGALQGAVSTASGSGSSTTQKAIGGALSGAGMGFAVTGGNPLGALAGGVLGLASGLF